MQISGSHSLLRMYPSLTTWISSFSSPEPQIDPRLWETLCRRTCAVGFLFEPYGAFSLIVLTWMHQLETLLIVLHKNQWQDTLFQGFPRALLSALSQEKSSGAENGLPFETATITLKKHLNRTTQREVVSWTPIGPTLRVFKIYCNSRGFKLPLVPIRITKTD